MTISGYNCKRVSSVRVFIYIAQSSGGWLTNQVDSYRGFKWARETLSYEVKHYEAGNKIVKSKGDSIIYCTPRHLCCVVSRFTVWLSVTS